MIYYFFNITLDKIILLFSKYFFITEIKSIKNYVSVNSKMIPKNY